MGLEYAMTTTPNTLKKAARERMAATGENYTTALEKVRHKSVGELSDLRSMMIVGYAGSGKTTLCTEIAAHAIASGREVWALTEPEGHETKRYRWLEEAQAAIRPDLRELLARVTRRDIGNLTLIVDDLGGLEACPELSDAILTAAREGRAFGFQLVVTAQHPSQGSPRMHELVQNLTDRVVLGQVGSIARHWVLPNLDGFSDGGFRRGFGIMQRTSGSIELVRTRNLADQDLVKIAAGSRR